jgi:uncharacterized DUF497 family protein
MWGTSSPDDKLTGDLGNVIEGAQIAGRRLVFMDAIAALEDTNRLEEVDTRFKYGEKRIQVVGMARGHVLFVIVTLRDEDTCRIISARKASRHEQDRYYAVNPETW